MSTPGPLDRDALDQLAKARDEQARETSRIEAEDFKWLMSDKRGRRIVWQLLQLTGVFRNPYAGVDAETNKNCGLQGVGQHYFGLINIHAAEKYEQMVKESKSK